MASGPKPKARSRLRAEPPRLRDISGAHPCPIVLERGQEGIVYEPHHGHWVIIEWPRRPLTSEPVLLRRLPSRARDALSPASIDVVAAGVHGTFSLDGVDVKAANDGSGDLLVLTCSEAESSQETVQYLSRWTANNLNEVSVLWDSENDRGSFGHVLYQLHTADRYTLLNRFDEQLQTFRVMVCDMPQHDTSSKSGRAAAAAAAVSGATPRQDISVRSFSIDFADNPHVYSVQVVGACDDLLLLRHWGREETHGLLSVVSPPLIKTAATANLTSLKPVSFEAPFLTKDAEMILCGDLASRPLMAVNRTREVALFDVFAPGQPCVVDWSPHKERAEGRRKILCDRLVWRPPGVLGVVWRYDPDEPADRRPPEVRDKPVFNLFLGNKKKDDEGPTRPPGMDIIMSLPGEQLPRDPDDISVGGDASIIVSAAPLKVEPHHAIPLGSPGAADDPHLYDRAFLSQLWVVYVPWARACAEPDLIPRELRESLRSVAWLRWRVHAGALDVLPTAPVDGKTTVAAAVGQGTVAAVAGGMASLPLELFEHVVASIWDLYLRGVLPGRGV